jgi:tRNA dimethylallyltransferase
MLENGFLEEVKTLKQNPNLHENLPSIRCVGYRQAWQYLNGEITAEFKYF